MMGSPPASPGLPPPRPLSAIAKPMPRSSSRLSMSGKPSAAGPNGSKASDDESRTAVNVAVRIRPPLRASDPGFDLIPQRFQRSMVQTPSSTSLNIDSPQGRKLFVFDRVFGPDVAQDGIWDYLAESVNSFTQGYNVALLAYGQSGAGKSYTMGTSGPLEQQDTELMGVVPRAATALFDYLEASSRGASISSIPASNKAANRSSMSHLKNPRGYGQPATLGDKNWSLKATYVEIYNEHLRDLLVSESTPAHERTTVAIRENTKGNIILEGLRQIDINSVEELMNALNYGSMIRQTDATAINAKSSRSHAVFSLNLVQRKGKLQTAQGPEKRYSVPLEAMMGQDTTITTDSKLHFVDLAGSERLKNTGAQGERAKEGISINAGLASLGKVISQLSSRQSGSHVSYRDSKLTRLLQDSLGGNAITYMIACVTPAEFHLSETLNTVQYAQRARAIQSKPRIQQIEEGDKQAIIDRLKAEVAFLREQIRSSERGGGASPRRAAHGSTDRPERHNERESELQNQLLDAQENYTTLSQRHVKLISELARAREHESGESGEDELLRNGQGNNSATDRLNRSNSFARAVEQVVLEYEKTIQSLEQSLSSTRGSLSNTETSLLEKETKCTYAETINNQLQARLHKLMDREASTENYLQDLETKLDGHTSGEEKNATIIMELRKEIARARENEASCEDYISTLEERLAECDQDAELRQREVGRLEQVIERQRSLGKLDALLYELDSVKEDRQAGSEQRDPAAVSDAARRRSLSAAHSRSQSYVSRQGQMEEAIPEGDEEIESTPSIVSTVKEEEGDESVETTEHAAHAEHVEQQTEQPTAEVRLSTKGMSEDAGEAETQSPAQTKYVADKLENVTQELFDLRVEHESTVTDFESLHSKYEEALRNLAELQDAVDEARQSKRRARESVASVNSTEARPDSFLSETRSSDLKDGPRLSLSRSLSSELSSAGESPATVDTSNGDVTSEEEEGEEDDETATTKPAASTDDLGRGQNELLAVEFDRLKALVEERETTEKELAERYADLESKHSETLDMVEELKTEVSKARASEPRSPRLSSPVIRRKSSQNLMIDRAHRSFASLRNIATENFEEQPEVMQNFELNLHTAMHELHSRSERIQELEADASSAKKEMDTKMTIISGLTRERSSLKAGPMDMSMVATLRDQLEQNEQQLNRMREAHAGREEVLTNELESLRQSLELSTSKAVTSTQAGDEAKHLHEEKINQMQAELASWEDKHKSVLDTMESTEAEMRTTIEQLEGQMTGVSAELAEAQTLVAAADGAKGAGQKHENLISFLRSEIDEYKAIINSNTAAVAELEQAHSSAKAELDNMSQAHGVATEEASQHKELLAKLEQQIATHEEAARTHRDDLAALKDNHSRELTDVKTQEQQGYEEQVEVLMSDHAEAVQKLETDLSGAREELNRVATQVAAALGQEVSLDKLTAHIESLASDRRTLLAAQKSGGEMEAHVTELTSINETIMRDLEAAKTTVAEMMAENGDKVPSSIVDQLSAVKNRMSDLESRSKKNSRLVEELEEQLQNNFDEAQMTNNRLSTLQTERNTQLDEASTARSRIQVELDTIREEYAALQTKYEEMASNGEVKRSNSNSTIRKSASHASLPSPPPAIPLPPLPGSMVVTGSGSPNGVPTSPTSPTMMRPQSKDNLMNISQVTEAQTQEQETRIRTIEKHLYAERQLTQTLEEALTDLEKQSNKVKADCDAWKKRSHELEGQVKDLRERPTPETQRDSRWSLQAVEEERKKRQAAEAARRQLEERMNAINKGKKKKGSLNCF